MNETILQRIILYCEKHNLLERGDHVVVACSGGADSVFLARLLQKMAARWELKLALVHVHHGIRGPEADRDEKFCRDFADACGLPFAVYHGDVPRMAEKQGLSLEEAGRVFRYKCLEEYCTENGFQKIAVAHHENDQAETVLFRMLRGSSLRGMGGMRPMRGRVIRPLLSVSREEIVETLREWGQDWREDSTNADMTYSRNFIRNSLLPLMQERISPASVRHLAEQAEQMQELYDDIEEQTGKYYSALVREYSERRRWEIRCDAFLELPLIFRRELAFRMMERCAGSRRDLTRRHLDSFCLLAESETGKRIALPGNMTAGRDYDFLWVASLERKCLCTGTDTESERTDSLPEEILLERVFQEGSQDVFLQNLSGQKERISMKIVPIQRFLKEKDGKLPKNNCTKCFDYDKIDSIPMFRHPQEGDYFLLDESGHRKKLSRYLIDQQVEREARRELWVLAVGHHVIWVPELGRVSADVYVTEGTETILYAVKEVGTKEEIHMDETIKMLYSEESVKKRIAELAEQINNDYQGKTLHLVCILKGSVVFCCELMKWLMVPVTLDFMTVSSYGDSTENGQLVVKKDLDESISGKDCLLVEDIVDTGNTLALLKENLMQRKPASLKLCTLLDKKERREADVEVEYVGFSISDGFVVGFGMDYAQRYRNLPYIGVLEVNEE